jgi:peptide/nickel transport system substrate-binding protein
MASVAGALGRVVGACAFALTLSACSQQAGGGPQGAGGTPVRGGTAYFAEQPLEPPTYIFPLVSGAYYTEENTSFFQTLMYEPLYWFGNGGKASVDYGLSIGDPPLYSDHDRVVTITLKDYRWSDGEPVSARDVLFWINLLKANRDNWASYVPGGFPDNVKSAAVLGPRTIRLDLNASYNPTWYTYNELSQITPLPLAWDRTSLAAPVPAPNAGSAPDLTPAGARAVYGFLDDRAKSLSTYATSPIWSVVDGPWRLSSLSADGTADFVPNRSYSGPDRPHLSRFVELPFTSPESELAVLRAGNQLSVGYLPDDDIPQARTLEAGGDRIVDWFPFQFDYFEPNFNNPTVGPIFSQLYFRQAFQHLVDEEGWIRAYYGGLGVPTYSPVPALPRNPYSDAAARVDPYPFDPPAAARILGAHGWKVVPGGLSSCVRPGTRAGECGKGIPAGRTLSFTLLYPSGLSYTDDSMVDLNSVARQVGIEISLKEVPATTISATILPCSPHQAACSWQLGQYGTGWLFSPDHYPSGEEIFETGALGNVANYSDATIDRLIAATTTAPPAEEQKALDAYANAVRLAVPNFWQPSPGTAMVLQGNLRGFVPNAYGFINPEQWYFTRP